MMSLLRQDSSRRSIEMSTITALEISKRLPLEVMKRGKHIVFTETNPPRRKVWKLVGVDESGEKVFVFDQDELFEELEK